MSTTKQILLDEKIQVFLKTHVLGDINSLSSFGNTALGIFLNEKFSLFSHPVEEDYLFFEALLNKADPNKKLDFWGHQITPLQLLMITVPAVYCSRLMSLLLKAGANPNVKTPTKAMFNSGLTPLEFAAAKGFFEVVEIVLRDPSIELEQIKGALILAREHNHEEVYQFIEKRIKQQENLKLNGKLIFNFGEEKANTAFMVWLESAFQKFLVSNYLAKKLVDEALTKGDLHVYFHSNMLSSYYDFATHSVKIKLSNSDLESLRSLDIAFNTVPKEKLNELFTLMDQKLLSAQNSNNSKILYQLYYHVLFEIGNSVNPTFNQAEDAFVLFETAEAYAKNMEKKEFFTFRRHAKIWNYGIESCGWPQTLEKMPEYTEEEFEKHWIEQNTPRAHYDYYDKTHASYYRESYIKSQEESYKSIQSILKNNKAYILKNFSIIKKQFSQLRNAFKSVEEKYAEMITMMKVNEFNKDDLKSIYLELSQSIATFKSKLNFFNSMNPIFKIMRDDLAFQQRKVPSLLAFGEKQTEILKVYSGFIDSVLKMEQSFSEDAKNISQQFSTIEKNIEEDYEKLKLLEKPSSFKRK